MPPDFAYLSRGQLYLKLGDSPARPVESRFGQSVRDRATQIRDRNAWKAQGSGARFMSGGMLWAEPGRDAETTRIALTGISAGCQSDELLYALDTSDVGGIFRVTEAGSQEQRLFHTADFRVRNLHAAAGLDRIACVLGQKGGNSCIAVMRGDGGELTEVTQGDTVDDSPRWSPGSSRELVFQSAAIGRDANGFAVAQAPFSIQKLDLEVGTMTTLAEDKKFDFLGPALARDGTLYCIRRPYRGAYQPTSLPRALLDFILLPFRLLYAIFQYLNFFTARYTGNTLITSAGARQKNADLRQMMVWGNLIDAQKAARESGDATPALVPKSWELIRRGPTGETEILARSVLCFDLCPNGSILYSNGSAIFHRSGDGATEQIASDSMIGQLIALPSHSG